MANDLKNTSSSATLTINTTTAAPTAEREERGPRTKAPEFTYADGDLVTILYRYGQVPNDYKQLLGAVRFVGGVARSVPGHVARQLQNGTRTVTTEDGREIVRRAYFKANNLFVLPDSATPVDYARFAHIKVEPTQVAAMLAASDVDEVVQLLGDDATAELIRKLTAAQTQREKTSKAR